MSKLRPATQMEVTVGRLSAPRRTMMVVVVRSPLLVSRTLYVEVIHQHDKRGAKSLFKDRVADRGQ